MATKNPQRTRKQDLPVRSIAGSRMVTYRGEEMELELQFVDYPGLKLCAYKLLLDGRTIRVMDGYQDWDTMTLEGCEAFRTFSTEDK